MPRSWSFPHGGIKPCADGEVTVDVSDDRHPPEFRRLTDAMIEHALNEIGIDRVRLEVRGGAENTDENWRRVEHCLISGFDGAILTMERRGALWAKFSTGAPQRQKRSVD